MDKSMRYWIILFALVVMAGCAAPRKSPGPAPTGFASADAKNVHDFLMGYQKAVNSGDEKAVARLYADGARMVPYLVENKRVLTKKELVLRLPYITKMERQADMRLAFREPMDIKVSGEAADVAVLADLSWREGEQARQAVLNCYFRLERIDYFWKIRQSHQEMAAPGQTRPGAGATPAIGQSPPGRPGTDGSPPAAGPGDGQNPPPLLY